MPTKTKPANPSQPGVLSIKIGPEERREILGALGRDEDSSKKQKELIDGLEEILSFFHHRAFSIKTKAMPAHVKAFFESMQPHVGSLIELMKKVAAIQDYSGGA